MVYLRITGRAIVNVHTANCEGAVGNYMSLSKMYVVRRVNGRVEVDEENVISGNMLKHWHAVAYVERLKAENYTKMCELCKRHVMYRSSLKLNDEFDYLEKCAVEDLHGFLDPDVQIRRESIARFSFMAPIEELPSHRSAVTHNRVVTDTSGKISGEMMIMKREYASGIYGFACTFDLDYVGRSQSDPSKVLNATDRKIRSKCAVLALMDVFSGKMGAAQARALPIIKVSEMLAVISKKPFPNLTHGFFQDYVEDSVDIINAVLQAGLAKADEVKVFCVGDRVSSTVEQRVSQKDVIVKCANVADAIAKIAEVVEKWLA